MKPLFTILLLTFFITSFGQTADDYLQKGIEKHNAKDYEGAIKEYNKAIKEDASLKSGYYNRGVCQLALKELKLAKKDFDTTIELDPTFIKAYYSRATVLVSQEKYLESLPDLDKIIELNPSFPNALTLRGQIRAQSGNKNGACDDFTKAKEIGDKQAEKYINQFCGNQSQKKESLSLIWPENENWKVANNQEDESIILRELIPTNETLENWTEIGTMTTIKGAKNIPVEKAMNLMFDQSKKNSPKAKLTFIEKNENTEFPWILFTIECPNFKDDKNPESQLWYIVQGKNALYTNFRAIKQATIPSDLKDKWSKFFKTATIISQ